MHFHVSASGASQIKVFISSFVSLITNHTYSQNKHTTLYFEKDRKVSFSRSFLTSQRSCVLYESTLSYSSSLTIHPHRQRNHIRMFALFSERRTFTDSLKSFQKIINTKLWLKLIFYLPAIFVFIFKISLVLLTCLFILRCYKFWRNLTNKPPPIKP